MTTDLAETPSAGLALLASLERSGAITSVGLTLTEEIPFDQYEALLAMFGRLHKVSAFLIGDALNYGERVYGETYVQAAHVTGLAEQTCMNYSSVCKRVARSRRRASLPFSVHAEVAALPPKEQQRILSRAVQEDLSRSQVREIVTAEKAAENGQPERQQILPPTFDVTELALAVARAARETGDQYLVPGPVMRPLLAALGEE